MAFVPDEPFPKAPGDDIRSKDWNDVVDEIKRIDQHKPDKDGTELSGLAGRVQGLEQGRVRTTGDAVTGNLSVSGKLGVGTTSLTDSLEVHGALRFDGNSNRRVFGAVRAGYDTVVVDGDYGELEIKGRVVDWSAGNLYLGYHNDHYSHEIQIGRKVRRTRFYTGNPTTQTMLLTDNKVGIGTSSPAYKLHVVGNRLRMQKSGSTHCLDFRADGGALDIESQNADLYINNNNRPVRIRNLVQGSSRAWKEDIASLTGEDAARLLAGMEPQAFRFKGDPSARRHLGFVAEDMPDGVATEEHEGFNPTAVIAVLTKVVKEQQRMLDRLHREVEILQNRG